VPTGAGDEVALAAEVVELAKRYVRYGYRRITASLRDAGWAVKRRLVERTWRRERLRVPQRKPRRGRIDRHRRSTVSKRLPMRLRPEHVWAKDLVADRTQEGRGFSMLCVVDEVTREALAISVAPELFSADAVDILAVLLIARGASACMVCRGPEFVAEVVNGWIKGFGAKTA
jgi:transposase InsO family protein